MIGNFNLRRIAAIIITFSVLHVMNNSIIAIKMQVLIAVNREKTFLFGFHPTSVHVNTWGVVKI